MSRKLIPVSTLVNYLKGYLNSNPVLHGVNVEGEISNLRKPYTGHWYFSLKDKKSSIQCVMFASTNKAVKFTPKDGDKVEIVGDVSIYEAGGSLQVIVHAMRPAGIGDLYLRLEELKKKLSEEGMFSEEHKKPLPLYPMDIALVTGNQTAAREDVLITLKKRWPIAKLTEYPAPVQGSEATPKIISALKKADDGGHQIILLVRGGGSIEDLWCFNDETLARCIYDLKTPIVTGIGHEIDFTIADFVSDYRANTPTGAVEASVPDYKEVLVSLNQIENRLIQTMNKRIELERHKLLNLSDFTIFKHPEQIYSQYILRIETIYEKLMRTPISIKEMQASFSTLSHRFNLLLYTYTSDLKKDIKDCENRLIYLSQRKIDKDKIHLSEFRQKLDLSMKNAFKESKDKLSHAAALMDAYSPLKVMARGYSVVTKENSIIQNSDTLQKNDRIHIRFDKGSVDAQVKEIYHGK